MIHQMIFYGEDGMMESAGVNEMEKYRKYVQKRRVAGSDEGKENEELQRQDNHATEGQSGFKLADLEKFREIDTTTRQEELERGYYATNSAAPALRRTDPGLYKKLYTQPTRKTQSYSGTGSYRSYSGKQTEIEDNRASMFAVKLIKQALACFAILGIIILMQSRSDMTEVLAVVKKQVVETNFEPKSLYEGILEVFNQCARALGGSP